MTGSIFNGDLSRLEENLLAAPRMASSGSTSGEVRLVAMPGTVPLLPSQSWPPQEGSRSLPARPRPAPLPFVKITGRKQRTLRATAPSTVRADHLLDLPPVLHMTAGRRRARRMLRLILRWVALTILLVSIAMLAISH